MAEADRAKWEAKYRAGAHEGRAPEPLLHEALRHAPPKGWALDVACGRGRHAIALAEAGYDVTAVDISPTALRDARARAGDLPIDWREADLDQGGLGRRGFQVVVCVDYTDERLMPALVDVLAPGGILVFAARPRARCRYGSAPGQVREWFADLETLVHREDDERVEYVGRRAPAASPR